MIFGLIKQAMGICTEAIAPVIGMCQTAYHKFLSKPAREERKIKNQEKKEKKNQRDEFKRKKRKRRLQGSAQL